MKKLLIAALLLGAAGVSAQERQRLNPECRREVISLCRASAGGDRSAMRACLIEKRDQLSQGCRSALQERMKARQGDKAAAREGQSSRTTGGTELSYGNDAKQKLDYWSTPSSTGAFAPLVVFVHGGGWSIGDKASGTGEKPAFYNGLGYAFASVNYRLVPNAKPDDQARDIAASIAFLRKDANQLGFDENRIVIIGHSAGAHLAALVSSDTRYLTQAGVPLTALRGTILLDGAGYDVAKQMALKTNKVSGMYDAAFGRDPAVQKALSPITYVGAPNSPRWLILHDANRPDARAQSEALAKGLTMAGESAAVKAVPNSSHMAINRDAGVAGTFVGEAIAAFLKSSR
jgi:arylformamidase